MLTRGASKVSVTSKYLLSTVALVDSVFTYTRPPKVIAGNGLDALSHAIEAKISTDASIFTDLYTLQAIEWIFYYLPRAYMKGGDVEARFYIPLAAITAGIPLNIAGAVLGHSIAQTFEPQIKMHHDTACGMTLPYILCMRSLLV